MRRLANIAVSLLAAAAGTALADGLNGLVEVEYGRSASELRSATSAPVHLDSDQLAHRYRLTAEKELSPALHLSGGGGFEQQLSWLEGGAIGRSDARNANLFATLALRLGLVDASAGYTWREQTGNVLLGPGSGFVREGPNAYLAWKPVDLPAVTLQVARPSTYDVDRRTDDRTSLDALLSSTWSPLPRLALQYSIGYSNPVDRLRRTDTRSVAQSARASYSASLFKKRVSASTSATVDHRLFQVASAGTSGTAESQRTPMAGYSLTEAFPATPVQDTLAANPPLVDGNLEASASINLGTRPSLGGDANPRDVGVQLADPATRVNLIYLWVDRALPGPVAASLRFAVYQSDDNLHWTEVPITGPVAFALFQTRFEIPIQATGARWLKVVTRPLDPAASLDERYKDVWVTELQLFFVEPVTSAQPWKSSVVATLNGSARTEITPALAHDVTLSANAVSQVRGVSAYVFANGLTYAKQLNPIFRVNARVAEQESGDLRGHQSVVSYSAALAADPLPAIGQSLTYSGQVGFTRGGVATTNSLSYFTRGTPYEGIGLVGGASYSVTTQPNGQVIRSELLTASTSLRPNRKVSLGAGYAHTASATTGGGQPRSATRVNRLEGSATVTPFNALYLSAGGSWSLGRGGGSPQGSFSASFSPFPGGNLQIGFSWVETVDAAGGRTRLLSPSARWNIRRGAALTMSYTWLDSRAGSQEVRTRVFGAKLQIAL